MILTAELRGMATAGLLAFGLALVLVSVPSGVPGIELLQSLRFHLAALGVPLAILLVLSGARWRGLLAVVLMLASVGQGAQPILDGMARRDAVTGATLANIKVLSFNVLANREGRAAADFIISQAPDIAVTMETSGIAAYFDDLAKVLPYRFGCTDRQDCDLAIFSRTPLLDPQMVVMYPFQRQRLAFAGTVIDGVPVTIAAVHLSKPYFDEASWMELNRAGRVLSRVEGRLIVAGDFNAAAWSNQMVELSAALDLAPPPFYPATWPVRAGALGVPIDNMFTRGDLLIDTIEAAPNSYGSNHRALLAGISLREAP
ncbi:endonuclease/exonuclease/phosphatase family protein [Devosia beringensis]|uniref:endonuclease/exonuclease/phosphatase family protein n=1 Tax=Devosia beringensis TaxID=2657486 RepID=UPI00186BA02B|nr:endonuclease/exonuclease/phosphatase family protein [Devosia beringensis]